MAEPAASEPPGCSCRRRGARWPARTSPGCAARRTAQRFGCVTTTPSCTSVWRRSGEVAGAIFEALEQVRVEALGAQPHGRASPPISPARTPRAIAAPPAARATSEADLADALELYARESLLGFHLPQRAARRCSTTGAPGWRAGPARTGAICARSWRTRRSSRSRVREMLAHLGLAEELGEQPEDPDSEQDEAQRGGAAAPATTARARAPPRTPSSAPSEADASASADEAAEAGRERAARRTRPRRAPTTTRAARRRSRRRSTSRPAARRSPIACSPPGSTRWSRPSELCSPVELGRLRAQLDQQLRRFQGMIGRLANRLQRRLLAQQTRSWEFDLDEGLLDTARLTRVVVNPEHAAVVQAREGHRVPRHRGLAADRQLRLDARPADRGRGDVRRHPRAHAGALRGQGRDPRLHHAQLEGRPEPRAVAARGQAAQSGPARTICATSSTRRPTAPGGARGATSA